MMQAGAPPPNPNRAAAARLRAASSPKLLAVPSGSPVLPDVKTIAAMAPVSMHGTRAAPSCAPAAGRLPHHHMRHRQFLSGCVGQHRHAVEPRGKLCQRSRGLIACDHIHQPARHDRCEAHGEPIPVHAAIRHVAGRRQARGHARHIGQEHAGRDVARRRAEQHRVRVPVNQLYLPCRFHGAAHRLDWRGVAGTLNGLPGASLRNGAGCHRARLAEKRHIRRKAAQAREDFPIARIVGFQFNAVSFRNRQRQLQRVDRIQAKPLHGTADRAARYRSVHLKLQRIDDQPAPSPAQTKIASRREGRRPRVSCLQRSLPGARLRVPARLVTRGPARGQSR